jgi:hypothetical protein
MTSGLIDYLETVIQNLTNVMPGVIDGERHSGGANPVSNIMNDMKAPIAFIAKPIADGATEGIKGFARGKITQMMAERKLAKLNALDQAKQGAEYAAKNNTTDLPPSYEESERNARDNTKPPAQDQSDNKKKRKLNDSPEARVTESEQENPHKKARHTNTVESLDKNSDKEKSELPPPSYDNDSASNSIKQDKASDKSKNIQDAPPPYEESKDKELPPPSYDNSVASDAKADSPKEKAPEAEQKEPRKTLKAQRKLLPKQEPKNDK